MQHFHHTRRLLLQSLSTSALAAMSSPLWAQSSEKAEKWPSKPLKLVVPYSPGGFTDQMARLVQPGLQQRLEQSLIVDNKPGANGIIGVDMVAKSAADGYTLGVVIAAHAANTSLYAKLPYDPKKDLRGVVLMGISPLLAAVSPQAPFKTATEMVAYAKENPGKISFGSSGNGSAAHLSTELFKTIAGVDMTHVPYKGAAPAQTDLMSGQIQLLLDAPVGLINLAKQGRVRLIGVAGTRRLPAVPDVPTFDEQGFKNFEGNTWAGMIAPAHMPHDIAQRIASEVTQLLHTPENTQRLQAMGTFPMGGTPEDFDRFLQQETQKWEQVIRHAKVKLDA